MTTYEMPITASPTDNSVPNLQQSAHAGHISWWQVLLAANARLVLIALGIIATYGYFVATGQAHPWKTAVGFTNFTMVLTADLGGFLLLGWLLRKEGLTFGQLINVKRPLWKEILLGVGIGVVLLIALYIANIISAVIVYGPGVFTTVPDADASSFVMPPLWVFWWSTLVLPITVAVVEELIYRGYVQPRITALTGKAWMGVVLTAFLFGLQHLVLPIVDVQTSLSRFIGTFLVGLLLSAIYQKQKRLLPLIIGHWFIDLLGLGLFPLLMVMSQAQ